MIQCTELDHVFLFVSSEARAREMMNAARLRVNYSRAHPGQGTRNLCACLDDMFIELLWLDGSEVSSVSDQISLGARGRGDGCPIGISWRGSHQTHCIPYAAPFLPDGLNIPVARQSLDLSLPFVFKSPGSMKPIDRDEELVGNRQVPHLTLLSECVIRCGDPERLRPAIAGLEKISVSAGDDSIRFKLCDTSGAIARDFVWVSDL